MDTVMQYDSRDILKTIVWAIKREKVDILVECDQELEAHNDQHVLLMLTPNEYEKYHELLRKTSIFHEVSERNDKGLV